MMDTIKHLLYSLGIRDISGHRRGHTWTGSARIIIDTFHYPALYHLLSKVQLKSTTYRLQALPGWSQNCLHWKTPLRSLKPITNPALLCSPLKQVPHLQVFYIPPGMVTPPLLWAVWFSTWQFHLVMEFFLISNLTTSRHSLRQFPLIVPLATWEKMLNATWLHPPGDFRQKEGSFSSSDLCFSPFPSSFVLLWTCSTISMSFL